MTYIPSTRTSLRTTGAPNGSVPQNITLLAESLRSFLDKSGAFLFPDLSRKDRSDSASRVSKYLFFGQIFAGPGDLEKMLCPWKELVAGK